MSTHKPIKAKDATPYSGKTAYFTARAWQEDGVWNAAIVDLPVVVFGESFEEASRNLVEALGSHLKVAAELGSLSDILAAMPQLETVKETVEIDEPNELFWRVPAPAQALEAHR